MKKLFFQKPLVLSCALFLLTLFFFLFWKLPHALLFSVVILGTAAVGLLLFLVMKKRLRAKRSLNRAVPMILLLSFFLSLSLLCAHSVVGKQDTLSKAYDGKTVEGVFLVEDLSLNQNSLMASGVFTEIDKEPCKIKATVFFFLTTDSSGSKICRGDKVLASYSLSSTKKDSLSEMQSLADGYYLKASAEGVGSILSRDTQNAAIRLAALREKMARLLDDTLSERGAGMMKALLLADKSGITATVRDGFKTLGISHLFAVSGLHLSILIGLAATLLEKLLVWKQFAYPILVVITLFYIMLTGFAPSMLRAGGMLLLFYLSWFFKRKRDSLTSLFAATTVIVLISPASILDVGLLMSFCATLGILVIASPLLRALFQKPFFQKKRKGASLVGVKLIRYVTSSAVLTLSATAAILPILALIEERVFSLAILSNLVFSPFFTLLLFLLPFLLLMLPIPFLSFAVGFLIDKLTGAVFAMALWGRNLSDLSFSLNYPFMPILILLLFASLVPLLVKKRGSLLTLVPILLFFLLANASIALADLQLVQQESLYYDSDGTNDTLVISYEKKGLVVDFSASSSFLKQSFDQTDVYSASVKADTLMLTSCRASHLSALHAILEQGELKHLILPTGSENCEAFASLGEEAGLSVTFYRPGDTVYWNGIALTTYPDTTGRNLAALEVSLAHTDVLYIKENAPMLFDIRFGPLSEKQDVLLFGAFGNAPSGGPFVFDADVIVQGDPDASYLKETENTALYYSPRLFTDSRKD